MYEFVRFFFSTFIRFLIVQDLATFDWLQPISLNTYAEYSETNIVPARYEVSLSSFGCVFHFLISHRFFFYFYWAHNNFNSSLSSSVVSTSSSCWGCTIVNRSSHYLSVHRLIVCPMVLTITSITSSCQVSTFRWWMRHITSFTPRSIRYRTNSEACRVGVGDLLTGLLPLPPLWTHICWTLLFRCLYILV
jgi:hypothetical protein